MLQERRDRNGESAEVLTPVSRHPEHAEDTAGPLVEHGRAAHPRLHLSAGKLPPGLRRSLLAFDDEERRHAARLFLGKAERVDLVAFSNVLVEQDTHVVPRLDVQERVRDRYRRMVLLIDQHDDPAAPVVVPAGRVVEAEHVGTRAQPARLDEQRGDNAGGDTG